MADGSLSPPEAAAPAERLRMLECTDSYLPFNINNHNISNHEPIISVKGKA